MSRRFCAEDWALATDTVNTWFFKVGSKRAFSASSTSCSVRPATGTLAAYGRVMVPSGITVLIPLGTGGVMNTKSSWSPLWTL
ncbi:hypothetical protein D3C85_1469920 [compost metagenome]